MKKDQKIFWLVEILLLGVLIWIFAMIWRGNQPAPRKRIICVVNDSTGKQWADLYNGMQLFARQQDIEFVMADTEQMQKYSEIREVVADEMADGMDGLIIEQIGNNPDNMLPKAMSSKVPRVILNGNGESNASSRNVVFQTKELAERLVDGIREDRGDDLPKETVGILLPDIDNPFLSACRTEIESLLQAVGVNHVWSVHTSGNVRDIQKQLNRRTHADVLITLDDGVLAAVGESVGNGDYSCEGIYGIGNSEESLWYVDKGVVKGLYVPDSFLMGYNAMETCVQMLHHQEVTANKDVGGRFIRKGDLFTNEQTQVYLFPRE